MNAKFLVKVSNGIGLFSILLLVYWVFTFILVTVFGLKVFRENLTETFALSILGILALMGGALMLNIMFNLTRIAERPTQDPIASKHGKKMMFGLIALFPLIAGILFTGDYLSTKKKEQFLIDSAKKVITDHSDVALQLANYKFHPNYIVNTEIQLNFLEKLDSAFNNVSVIVPDQINNAAVYLTFDEYGLRNTNASDNEVITAHEEAMQAANAAAEAVKDDIVNQPKLSSPIQKADYLKKLTLPEREYLDHVFKNNLATVRFSSSNGNYELFYPYQIQGKTKVILYFSDYQRYGKLGS